MPTYANINSGTAGNPGISPFDPNFENWYLNDQPQAAWWHYLMGNGWGGTSRPQQYAQNQFGRYQNMYNAQAAQNPLEGFNDWLRRTQPNPLGDYWNQSPNMRGDATSGFYNPHARWIMGS